uniref:Uncharacterized protein n=1 Tax=Hyaloperonospora arabidopsidis (strain Emoy2) TaxID=559515 RepID=M4BVA7_HYAAE
MKRHCRLPLLPRASKQWLLTPAALRFNCTTTVSTAGRCVAMHRMHWTTVWQQLATVFSTRNTFGSLRIRGATRGA